MEEKEPQFEEEFKYNEVTNQEPNNEVANQEHNSAAKKKNIFMKHLIMKKRKNLITRSTIDNILELNNNLKSHRENFSN